jgi:hypothetical protein
VCGEVCPDVKYCIVCSKHDSILSSVVDHFEFKTYKQHGDCLDEDPILILPCGHFFASSTLDGHMEIQKAYGISSNGTFTHVRPLDDSSFSEKAKQCPDCRAAIYNVRRYFRITKYGMLRSLQRKHLDQMHVRLAILERKPPEKRSLRVLRVALNDAKASPMQQVYDACGRAGDDPPSSSSGPVIRALMLNGESKAARSKALNDKEFVHAKEAFEEAIAYATANKSARSESIAHLAVAGLLAPWISQDMNLKMEVDLHLDSVINAPILSPELKAKAGELKESLSAESRSEELKKVISAMNQNHGYNYGTNASSHWYQCPNGHPYYIGECGGAMQESRCLECGERVGGRSHQLVQTNSRWSGLSDLR